VYLPPAAIRKWPLLQLGKIYNLAAAYKVPGLSMQSNNKCPNCGATVFSQPIADNNLLQVTINCEYCGSQFNVRNPFYHPEPVVHTTINTYSATYTYSSTSTRKSSGFRNAKDWEHKVARFLSYAIGGLMVPFVIGIWVVTFTKPGDLPIAVPITLTGLMFFFFFLARACGKELKRRRTEGGMR